MGFLLSRRDDNFNLVQTLVEADVCQIGPSGAAIFLNMNEPDQGASLVLAVNELAWDMIEKQAEPRQAASAGEAIQSFNDVAVERVLDPVN